MTQFGKLIIIAGMGLILIGSAVWALGKAGFRGLPGDVHYESEHVRFYFPIVTCLLLSAFLTLAMWIWRWLSKISLNPWVSPLPALRTMARQQLKWSAALIPQL